MRKLDEIISEHFSRVAAAGDAIESLANVAATLLGF
jgi:hypothetical protein